MTHPTHTRQATIPSIHHGYPDLRLELELIDYGTPGPERWGCSWTDLDGLVAHVHLLRNETPGATAEAAVGMVLHGLGRDIDEYVEDIHARREHDELRKSVRR